MRIVLDVLRRARSGRSREAGQSAVQALADRHGMHHLRRSPADVPVVQLRLAARASQRPLVSRTARMVLHFSNGAINVAVDPAYPERWRREPYFGELCKLSLNGIRVTPGGGSYATLVVVGAERFLLLGRTVVPDPTLFGTAFVPLTPDTFAYWKARSPEHLQRLNARVAEIHRVRQEFGACAIPEDDDPYPPYRPALLAHPPS
jgi:hypothetical protein